MKRTRAEKLRRLALHRELSEAQYKHPMVTGVTMFCEQCLREFKNVHPTAPAFCGDGHKPVQVRPAKHIVGTLEVVTRFFMRTGK